MLVYELKQRIQSWCPKPSHGRIADSWTHQIVKHSSVDNTLTALRERFWILRGRQAGRKASTKTLCDLQETRRTFASNLQFSRSTKNSCFGRSPLHTCGDRLCRTFVCSSEYFLSERLWEVLRLPVHMCHFPSGASGVNKKFDCRFVSAGV